MSDQEILLKEDPLLEFIPLYMLLLELPGGNVILGKAEELKGPIVATAENQQLLREMGDRMLESKLIIGYQIVRTVNFPKRTY